MALAQIITTVLPRSLDKVNRLLALQQQQAVVGCLEVALLRQQELQVASEEDSEMRTLTTTPLAAAYSAANPSQLSVAMQEAEACLEEEAIPQVSARHPINRPTRLEPVQLSAKTTLSVKAQVARHSRLLPRKIKT